MAEEPAGPILDGLGVMFDLADGDLVSDALVIAKTVNDRGRVNLLLANSDGLSWLDQRGLVAAAEDLIRSTPFDEAEDE